MNTYDAVGEIIMLIIRIGLAWNYEEDGVKRL